MEVMVTTGDIKHAKLQSNHHHQQTNTQLFTGHISFLSPTNTVMPYLTEICEQFLKLQQKIGLFLMDVV